MATPTTFTADMLKDMAKALDEYKPRQSLLMSAGFHREALAVLKPTVPEVRDNPLFGDYTTTRSLAGIPVETFRIPPEEVIDWSGCRSPSRAKRRHARGFPQRIKIEYRERAYLINRDALAMRWGREMDARLFAAMTFTKD